MTDEYPEHDKRRKIRDKSQAIGEFLDLGPYTLCQFIDEDYEHDPCFSCDGTGHDKTYTNCMRVPCLSLSHKCMTCNGKGKFTEHSEGWFPVGDINKILADWFDIDLDKIEEENLRILAEQRALNERVAREREATG